MDEKQEHKSNKAARDLLHTWVGILAIIFTGIWGAFAYYIQAEDSQMRIHLQAQITRLQEGQKEDVVIRRVVSGIDKKLVKVESMLTLQTQVIAELKELREDVGELKLSAARRTR